MNYFLKSVSDLDAHGKKVFVRCDLDVTIENGKITDPTRLISSISTLEYLMENGAMVIAAGHLGRPIGEDKKYTLHPVARWFADQFGTDLEEIDLHGLKAWNLRSKFVILENLRFYREEEENDEEFAKKLASLVDIYVNEAFGSSHRAHASIVGVPGLLPHFAGFHLQKEVKILSGILENPKRPLTFIVGGAKIETKLPLISKMHTFADSILVGGELAEQVKVLAHEEYRKINGQKADLVVADLNHEKTDILLGSLRGFSKAISISNMIVWNGPMGYLEGGKTQTTEELAKLVLNSSAYKIVGGGDTVSYLNSKKILEGFDFVSMGGGAMLEFLSGIKLPGLLALEE